MSSSRSRRQAAGGLPTERLTVWTVMRKAPPLPFLPASAHGTDVVVFPLVYSGDIEAGRRAAAPVLQFGKPTACALGPTPYAAFQTAFDPLLAPGSRNYWKSNNFSTLSDAALDVVIASAAKLPGDECEIFVGHVAGAMARVPPTATPFAGRDACYIMNVHGRWSEARDDERVRAWARTVFEDAAPHATGGGYVNFLTDDEAERVAASYGANYPRLQAVKPSGRAPRPRHGGPLRGGQSCTAPKNEVITPALVLFVPYLRPERILAAFAQLC